MAQWLTGDQWIHGFDWLITWIGLDGWSPYLMRPRDELKIVRLVELVHHVSPEQIPRSSRAQPPAVYFLGIGPEQVTHRPVVWHFLLPVQYSDLQYINIYTYIDRVQQQR